jgi:UPF0755 protein
MRVIRLAAIILTLSFLGLAIAVGTSWYELNEPVPNPAAGKVINVPMGATPDQVVGVLQENGVIKNSWPLRIYIKLKARGKLLKAGDYMFDSPVSPLQALKKLESGEQSSGKITIVEGWTRWDIANAMMKLPSYKLKSTNEVLGLLADTRSIQDIDKNATSLEGYIFPETYYVLSSSKPADTIAEAVALFKKHWKKELEPLAQAQGATTHAIVTVASIIETEAKLKEERPIIASVIYNRIARKMPLGMDSTVVYAAKIAGKWRDDGKVYQSDIDRDSPYNTRKVIGLPIGPVGNPGLNSLRAALQPAKTDYIYYVRNPARNDGAHNFYSSEAKFAEGVQALRNWEKQRDTAQAAAALHKPQTAVQQPSTATQNLSPTTSHTPGAQLPAEVQHSGPAATPPRAPSAEQHSASVPTTNPSQVHGKPQAHGQKSTSTTSHAHTQAANQHSPAAHAQSKTHGHKHAGHH